MSFDNLRRKCRLVWPKGNFFGVAFENQSSPTGGETQVGEAEVVIAQPAFSILTDSPNLAGPENQNASTEFGSKITDRKSEGQVDLRFTIGFAIALALPVLISMGAYLATTVFLRAS